MRYLVNILDTMNARRFKHSLLFYTFSFAITFVLASCGSGLPVTAVPPASILAKRQLQDPHYRWVVGTSVTTTRFEPLLAQTPNKGIAVLHIQSDDDLELLNYSGDTLRETLHQNFATEKRDRWDAILHAVGDTLYLAGPHRTDNQDSMGYHFEALSLLSGSDGRDVWDNRVKVVRQQALRSEIFGAYQRVPSEDSSTLLMFYEDRTHFLDEKNQQPYIVLHSDLYDVRGTKIIARDIPVPMPFYGEQRQADRYWRDVRLGNDGTVYIVYYAPKDSLRVLAYHMRDGSSETLGVPFAGVDYSMFKRTFSKPSTAFDPATRSLVVAVADGEGENTRALDVARFDFANHSVKSGRYQPTENDFRKLGDIGDFENYQPLEIELHGPTASVVLGKFNDASSFWIENDYGSVFYTEHLGNYTPSPERDHLYGRSGRSFVVIGFDADLSPKWENGIKCEAATGFTMHTVHSVGHGDQLRFLYADHTNKQSEGLLERDIDLSTGTATPDRTILHYDDNSWFDLGLTQWQEDNTMLLFGRGNIIGSSKTDNPTIVKVSVPAMH